MKKNTKTVTAVLGAAALVAAICAAVFYFISITGHFNLLISHFDGYYTVPAFVWCFAAALVLCAAAGIATRKKLSVTDGGSYHIALIAIYVIAGGLLLAHGILGLKETIYEWQSAVAKAAEINKDAEFTKEVFIAFAEPILAIVSCAYFILISGKEKLQTVRAFFGIAVIAWGLVNTLGIYFKEDEPINSASKAILLLISTIILVFVAEDARFPLGRQTASAYSAVALICVCAGVSFAVPNLIVAILHIARSGDTSFAAPPFDLLSSALNVALALCAAVRLATFGSSLGEYVPPKHDKKKTSAKAIPESAEGEEDAVAEDDAIDEAIDEADEAIDDASDGESEND